MVERIRQLAKECGYFACGVTDVAPFVEYGQAIEDLCAEFPQMAELYDWMRRRVNPTTTMPTARSIVVCIRRYGKYELPENLPAHIGRNYLFDRRYAGCPEHDMHKRFNAGLRELGIRYRRGGVPDRWAAARSGVAQIARNCFAYSAEAGSWVNIETWRIETALPPDEPTLELPCPETCSACMDACPTGAITGERKMRMDRCGAYLTYEAPLPLDPDLESKIGPWVYGCDACQLVCPLNANSWQPLEKADWLAPLLPHLTIDALAEMDQDTYERLVQPAFWYIKKNDLNRWHQNAKRAKHIASRS